MGGSHRGWLLVVCVVAGCGAAPPPVETRADDDEPETYAVALRLEDAGTDENETPHTAVSLVRIAPGGERTVESLRDEIGACYNIEASGALVAARCWWAGEGARYVVRREGDAVIALRAQAHEETDEGPLEEIGRVEVPADAELQVLLPGREAAVPGD